VHISNEIEVNDDLAELILSSQEIKEGDILVIAQKIISKQEGRIIELSKIEPSLLAQGIASQYHKDPRIVELILSESKKIVRMQNGVIIVETNHGFICANAGIDESNVKDGFVTLLPVDSDLSAKKIRDGILNKTRKNIAVVVSDTFGRPFRNGQTNCAIGLSGITPILDYAGTQDGVTAIAISDEIASTAELVMGKNNKCPVAIIRDYKFSNESENISEIIRPENEDLFR
jgi:coenzyme F420-0:L-glutamate ligase/coenzyme F420-1:gamma-L-glutamate ligase